jgi:hypothetical protein
LLGKVRGSLVLLALLVPDDFPSKVLRILWTT